MSAIDNLRSSRCAVSWARVRQDMPGGLHEPQLPGDVGWDLEAMEDVVIPPMGVADVPVNARLHLPDGVWAEIRARSSLARLNLAVHEATIDTGYRGQLWVIMRNMRLPSEEDAWPAHRVAAGDRVGQLVFHKVAPVWATEVSRVVTDTARGEDGFGSTGK